MKLNNEIIEDIKNIETSKRWTFGELISVLKRNDPDELFKLGFIKNFRGNRPIDGVEYCSDLRVIQYLLSNNAVKVGLESYYRSMTELIQPGKYTYHLLELIHRSLSRELHELERIPISMYDDLYRIFISKSPQDGSVNIFDMLSELDLDFLQSLRTDLTKYSMSLLSELSKYKDKYPISLFTHHLDEIHQYMKNGYDLQIVLDSIQDVESEISES